VASFAAGDAHSVFVSNHGDVYTVGRGLEGQLGRPGDARSVGRVSGPLEGERIKSVAAGAGFTLAVTEDGRLFEWGMVFQDGNAGATPGSAAPERGTEAFARWRASGGRSDALTAEERAGLPAHADLEDPALPGQGSTAAKIAAARETMDPLAIARAAGIDEARAWEIAGTVLPGMAEDLERMTPRKRRIVIRSALRFLASSRSEDSSGAAGVAADEGHARARAFDADVLSSGILQMKLERVAVPAPRPVPLLAGMGLRVARVAAGHGHVVIVAETGEALSAGFNDRGQLGLGHRISVPTFQPLCRALAAPEDRRVAAARARAAASRGELPDCGPETAFAGAVAERAVRVHAMTACAVPRFRDVACGQAHTLLLDAEGRVWATGSGGLGQLGNGSGGDRVVPSLVPCVPATHPDHADAAAEATEDAAAAAAAAGMAGHRSAVIAGAEERARVAAAGRRTARVVGVSCGDNHSLLLTDDSCLWGMGHAEYGQMTLEGRSGATRGDLAMPPRYFYTPRLIGASVEDPLRTPLHAKRVVSASAGSQFSAARTSDGGVVVFGWGSYGVLGDGSRADGAGGASALPPAVEAVTRRSQATRSSALHAGSGGVGAFGPERPALGVVCGRDHVMVTCVPDGDPAAQAWGPMLGGHSCARAPAPAAAGGGAGLDGSDSSEDEGAAPASWSRKGDVARAAARLADTLVVPIARQRLAAPARAADAAGSTPAMAPGAAAESAAPSAPSADRRAVVAKLEALLGGLRHKAASDRGIEAPRENDTAAATAADVVSLPCGHRGTAWRAAFLAHWPLLAARWPALRAAGDGVSSFGSGAAAVTVAPATSELGRDLLRAAGSDGAGIRWVVAVSGVHPLSAADAVAYAYQDVFGTPQHRARQVGQLAAVLGAEAMRARALMRELGRSSAADVTTGAARASASGPSGVDAAGSADGGSDSEHMSTSSWGEDMSWLLAHGREHGDVRLDVSEDDGDELAGAATRAHALSLIRSDFFRVALEAGLRREGAAGRSVALPGVGAGTVGKVLDWLHRGRPDVIDGESVLPLLAASRRLCVDELLREVQAALEEVVDATSAATVLEAAEALDLPRLAAAARKHMHAASASASSAVLVDGAKESA